MSINLSFDETPYQGTNPDEKNQIIRSSSQGSPSIAHRLKNTRIFRMSGDELQHKQTLGTRHKWVVINQIVNDKEQAFECIPTKIIEKQLGLTKDFITEISQENDPEKQITALQNAVEILSKNELKTLIADAFSKHSLIKDIPIYITNHPEDKSLLSQVLLEELQNKRAMTELDPEIIATFAMLNDFESLQTYIVTTRGRDYSSQDLREILQKAKSYLINIEEKYIIKSFDNIVICYENIIDHPSEAHKLSPSEALQISIIAENLLSKSNSNSAFYVKKTDHKIARSLILDPTNNLIHILSKDIDFISNPALKDNSDRVTLLYRKGGIKKVTSSLIVTRGEKKVIQGAQSVNKDDTLITPRTIELHKQFSNTRGLVGIRSDTTYTKTKGADKVEKQTFIQDAYKGDIEDVMQDKGEIFTPEEAFKIISDIAQGLAAMHKLGYVHRDLKTQNILVRTSDSGEYEAGISDFDMTFKPSAEEPPLENLRLLYGTLPYSSPEAFKRFVQYEQAKLNDETIEAPQVSSQDYEKEDLYALGYVVLTTALGNIPAPWFPFIEEFMENKNERTYEENLEFIDAIAKEMQTPLLTHTYKSKFLKTFDSQPLQDQLEYIASELLEPDPSKRMTIEGLLEIIDRIKKTKGL